MRASTPDYVNEQRVVSSKTIVVDRGLRDYQETLAAMRNFTLHRDSDSVDELWVVEHPAVFTLGQAADSAHVLQHSDIPIVRTDRGGQVTYHAPGQLVVYPLLDLRRKQLGVKALVWLLEQSVLDLLCELSITAERRDGAPGIYISGTGAKIAALGLRVKQMRTYHGLSLNVDMDLSPFRMINPCGYANMPVTDIATEKAPHMEGTSFTQVKDLLLSTLSRNLKLQYAPTL